MLLGVFFALMVGSDANGGTGQGVARTRGGQSRNERVFSRGGPGSESRGHDHRGGGPSAVRLEEVGSRAVQGIATKRGVQDERGGMGNQHA